MSVTRLALAIALLGAGLSFAAGDDRDTKAEQMLFIEGGTFDMGDVFDEGVRFATPVHEVTVSSFYLNKHEVTVEEFAAFVKDAGYVTAAERGDNRAAQSGKVPAPQTQAEYDARMASGGALILDPAAGETSWGLGASWRNPLYQQSPQDPVVCVSWTDAVNYCNWLSTKEGLPVAYDVRTGDLLDAKGQSTTDVTKVRGYRLPTEAEWEYAARERGRKVRFGNGQDVARPAEMNFNAAEGEFKFAEKGKLRGKTVPVGSFKPNSLGLYDMSGNVWEWCSDIVGRYPQEPQTNPYQQKGLMGPRRAARGGPWAGDAGFARVSVRLGWVANDRCNNIGFRIARSK
ncbi:MAG TPA: formylglycine-generating enzyme family protein [Phycisphaerae bacterium]|nr:formylglycine-generating enzyme family protein [Phycisphaerae bacterium]